MRYTLLALTAVTLALLAGAQSTVAESPAGPIQRAAVDPNIEGNTATSLGAQDVCAEMDVGAAHQIDVTVEGVPPIDPGVPLEVASSGGLVGFQFQLLYDPQFLRVTAYDVSQLLASGQGSDIIDFTSPVPDDSGNYLVAAADFGTDPGESGSGVLVRLTIEGVAQGTSQLIVVLEPPESSINDTGNNVYEITTVENALIAVGRSCASDATRPPLPADIPSPIPADGTDGNGDGGDGNGGDGGDGNGEDGNGNDGSETPGAGGETPRGTGESPRATDGSPTATNGQDDGVEEKDDGGGAGLWVGLGVAAALIVAAAGAGYYFLRVRRRAQ